MKKQNKALVTGITNFHTAVILISKLDSLEQVIATENVASVAAFTNLLLTASYYLQLHYCVVCCTLAGEGLRKSRQSRVDNLSVPLIFTFVSCRLSLPWCFLHSISFLPQFLTLHLLSFYFGYCPSTSSSWENMSSSLLNTTCWFPHKWPQISNNLRSLLGLFC